MVFSLPPHGRADPPAQRPAGAAAARLNSFAVERAAARAASVGTFLKDVFKPLSSAAAPAAPRTIDARDQSATLSSLNCHKMRVYARPYSWRQTCGSKAHVAYRSAPAGGNADACLDSAMGKRSKFKEARRQQTARAVCAVLAAHSQRKNAPVVVAHCGEFKPQYRAKIEAYVLRGARGLALPAQEPFGRPALHRSGAVRVRQVSGAGAPGERLAR
jgi:hypothetical protein